MKKHLLGLIISIILVLLVGTIAFSIWGYGEYSSAKNAYDNIRNVYDDSMHKQQLNDEKQANEIVKAKLFTDFEGTLLNKMGAAISTVGTVTTILGIIVTVATFLMVFLTIITSLRYTSLEESLKTKEAEINAKLLEVEEQYSWVNILPYLSLGNYNKLSGNDIYAKNDYQAAYFLDRKNIFVNYFLGVYYADLYSAIVKQNKDERKYTEELQEKLKDEFLDKARNHIQWAIDAFSNNKSDEELLKENVIKSELYTTLGSIYGLYGKSYLESSIQNKKARCFFEKSIDYLNQAIDFSKNQQKLIEFDVHNSETYVGLGISNAYLLKCIDDNSATKLIMEVYNNFESAIKEDQKNFQKRYKKNNLPWRDLEEEGYLDENDALHSKIKELKQKYFNDENIGETEIDKLKRRVIQLEEKISQLVDNR